MSIIRRIKEVFKPTKFIEVPYVKPEVFEFNTQPIGDIMYKAINDLKKLTKEAPTESQNKRILKHLKSGKTLTGLEALRLFDCFSLPQRIGNLRSFGFDIKTTMITTYSGKRIAEYSIESE